MKLVTDDEVILGSSQNTAKKFQITASAKAFKILSSGLYKNKPRAIIRELACNALDAHTLNGNTDPFEIKVPSAIDPRFVIRDFGPGLNDEDMMNLYTTYFASTKNNSNDFIGALGLGSKSPFSYTDTFTVVSYFGGQVRGYTAMLDGGEPVLRPIFVEDMKEGERTGIEITVPVKSVDLGRWRSEIAHVLRPFGKVAPVIKGSNLEIDYFPTDKPVWFGGRTGDNSGLYAIYGNIVYPLNEVPGLQRSWMQLNNSCVYVHFDLGELDIAASREELSLDEETVKNIVSKIDSISKTEMAETIAELTSITNPRELYRRLVAMSNEARGIMQRQGVTFHNGMTVQSLQKKYVEGISDFIDTPFYNIEEDPKLGRVKRSGYGYSQTSRSIGPSDLVGYQKTSINILIDDKPSKRLTTVRGMYHTDDGPTGRIVVLKEDDEDQMQILEDLKDLFAGDTINIYRVSECDKFIKKAPQSSEPREKRPAANNVHHIKIDNGTFHVTDYRMTSDELKDLEGLVILQKRDDVHDFPSGYRMSNLDPTNIRNAAIALGIKEYYVVRSTVFDRLVKYDNMTSLLDEMTNRFIDLVDTVDYDQYSGTASYGSRVMSVINQHKDLNFLNAKFTASGKTSQEAKRLQEARRYLYGFSIYSEDGEQVHPLKQALEIVLELEAVANKASTELVKKFEQENPVVYYVLSNCYSISDNIIKNVNTIFNNGAHAAP